MPVVTNEGIASTVARPLQETAARPTQDITFLARTISRAADTNSFQEPELPQWDMSTAETKAAWTQGRKEARARFREEAQAAAQGETLPPVANPSPTMLLYYSYLMARRGWEQRQEILSASNANTAADLSASSADSTSSLVARSVSAVADMYWCIDNLGKAL